MTTDRIISKMRTFLKLIKDDQFHFPRLENANKHHLNNFGDERDQAYELVLNLNFVNTEGFKIFF